MLLLAILVLVLPADAYQSGNKPSKAEPFLTNGAAASLTNGCDITNASCAPTVGGIWTFANSLGVQALQFGAGGTTAGISVRDFSSQRAIVFYVNGTARGGFASNGGLSVGDALGDPPASGIRINGGDISLGSAAGRVTTTSSLSTDNLELTSDANALGEVAVTLGYNANLTSGVIYLRLCNDCDGNGTGQVNILDILDLGGNNAPLLRGVRSGTLGNFAIGSAADATDEPGVTLGTTATLSAASVPLIRIGDDVDTTGSVTTALEVQNIATDGSGARILNTATAAGQNLVLSSGADAAGEYGVVAGTNAVVSDGTQAFAVCTDCDGTPTYRFTVEADGDATVTGALTVGSSGTAIIDSTGTSAVIDFASIAANSCDQSGQITLAGAGNGMPCALGFGQPAAGLIFACYVFADTDVRVRVCNVTTAAIDPASATFRVRVFDQ